MKTIQSMNIGGDYDGDVAWGNFKVLVARIKKGPGKGQRVQRKLHSGYKVVWGTNTEYSDGPLNDLVAFHLDGLRLERKMMVKSHLEQTNCG